ncbi:MAG: HD domain-containing protein [Desulfuromonadaceae bacterium]|jgi:hypothetical protein|nr:HD domain-containing protein [Desulfuromonadaceae bacterium]
MTIMLYACGIIGGLMIIYGLWSIRAKRTAEVTQDEWVPLSISELEPDDDLPRTTLEDISQLWTGRVVQFTHLSRLWREPAPKQEDEDSFPRPVFRHSDIEEFYKDIVEPEPLINGDRKTVIVHLLKILDEEGMCPSVVGIKQYAGVGKQIPDPDSAYGTEALAQLATVPLYQHSLSVTRKFVAKNPERIMLPTILIVSLAHDIGKIPSYHNQYYSTADHPRISVIILASMPEYVALPNKNELDNIIRNHHQITPSNPLTACLKRCDQEARNDELGAFLGLKAQLKSAEVIPLPIPTPLSQPETNTATDDVSQEWDHPLGALESVKYVSQKVKLPTWFNADSILSGIHGLINQVEKTSSGVKWHAVSLPNGLVYVKPEALWQVIHQVSNGDPMVLVADADEETKRNLLYTVVWELSATRDAIATELMTNSYYTTKASIVSNNDKAFSKLLIPFRVDAFGVLTSDLESTKPAVLRKIVKDIRPKQAEENE